MLNFLREQNGAAKLLKHLNCSAITDLIIKLINLEDIPEGSGTLKWLKDQGLIEKLFYMLDSKLDVDVCSAK